MARSKITKICEAPYWPLRCSEGVFGGDVCVGLSDISERCGGNFILLVGRSNGEAWVEDFAFGLIVLYVGYLGRT